MSDHTIAYYDTARDAVILRTESGSEIDVLNREFAFSLGREIMAAALRQDTGYTEFLAQEREDAPADDHPDTDPGPYPGWGSGDVEYDEAQAQEAELAALSEPQQRAYSVLARFIVRATSDTAASGQVATDLAAHPDVDEVWTETTFTD